MKILVVSQYFYPENFRINDIVKGLIERGHSVDVLTSLPNVPGGEFFEGYSWRNRGEKNYEGATVERVGVIKRGNGSPVRWVLNCASFAFNSLFHLPHLKKNGYDVVFVFNNSPVTKILPAKVFSKRCKIPNVVFLLDIWPDSMFSLLKYPEDRKDNLFMKATRWVSRWLYKSVDMFLISSKGFEGKLRSMGIKGDTEYFPNYAEPLELKSGERTRKSLGLKRSDTVIGFAGNVGVAQGLESLVEAARLSAGNVKYLIVGDGSELSSVKAAVKAAGLQNSFVFSGWVDSSEVPSYLELCDALLVPLKDGGVLNLTVPAKLQTYMYASKPVIAFLNGAGADTVKEAECGFAVRAQDASALSETINEIAAMPKAELKRLGENGKRYCDAHFDREKVLDSLVRHLEKAIESYKR